MPTTAQLRRDVATLAREASRDLGRLWTGADTAAALEAALRDLLPDLVDAYGSAAATVTADWYDELREQAEVRRRFRAIPADIANTGTDALVGWALSEAKDLPSFQTLILGGTQRRIANFSRLTVTRSSVEDPSARGWMRVGDGNSCGFCSMLLSRGAVYSEASADFAAHDHCGCAAAPAF